MLRNIITSYSVQEVCIDDTSIQTISNHASCNNITRNNTRLWHEYASTAKRNASAHIEARPSAAAA